MFELDIEQADDVIDLNQIVQEIQRGSLLIDVHRGRSNAIKKFLTRNNLVVTVNQNHNRVRNVSFRSIGD